LHSFNFCDIIFTKLEEQLMQLNYDKLFTALDSIVLKAKTVQRGDSVSWNSSGGKARGKVIKVITEGSEQVPNSSFTITGTTEDPGALIRVYTEQDGKYRATETIVGHKVKTLTKIPALD
jgi:hypothetical protein